jgi:protein-S-isoprenylcysteine O-methyltransferase Ste14
MNVPPLLQLATGVALAAAFAAYVPLGQFETPNWTVFVATLAGCLFLLPAVASFARHETTVNPQAPSQTTTLVTDGVYGVTRNPMYVGMLLILIAFTLWLGAPSAFVIVVAFFLSIDRFQIRAEEHVLGQKFGNNYQEYMGRVPRWLII